ncbi:hypothetical protein [Methylobacterium sp. ID0610]|uniref:hypothetical protein n=1 Tax=Methylobacterium carpenticola TaxID=3344827 RepID=UPI0036ABAEDE
MTAYAVLAFVLTPILVVTLGYGAVRLQERELSRARRALAVEAAPVRPRRAS